MKTKWPLSLKAVCLFLGIYLLLYMFNSVSLIAKLFAPLWYLVIPPFAKLCGYTDTVEISYRSVDNVFLFFKICICAVTAFALSILILVVDFKRNHYNTPLKYLTICIRYFVFYMAVSFSIMKFLPIQFPTLTEGDLNTKLGDMSPGVLLFKYMSYSRPYVLLVATLQMLGGLLLLSRKTVMIGALISIGVMFNVLMVNLCYNYGQKILSLHLVLMLLYLILLDGKALFQFFVLRVPATPNANNVLFAPLKIKFKSVLKFTILAVTFCYFGYIHYDTFKESSATKAQLTNVTQFFGVYNIQQHSRNINDASLGNLPDSLNWKVFYQSVENKALIKTQNDSLLNFAFEPDINKQLFRIKSPNEAVFYELPYERIDTHKIRITGSLSGNYVDFTMHRIKSFEYLRKRQTGHKLTNDQFMWIKDW